MKTVLVVDDMQAELDLLTSYLATGEYIVVTAADGKQAMNRVTEIKPDVIVTDWMMPEMGGLELCRKLKKSPEMAHIPVIACTAKDRDVDRSWAQKQGVAAYITKPCTKEQLLATVKSVVGN